VIVPAIGGLANAVGNVGANAATGQAGEAPAGVGAAEGALAEGGANGAGAAAEATGGGTPSFGSALTEAISSLETTQAHGSAAAQALATGSVADPEAAVATVEDAALAMQLAAQIRGKATEAAQTIFNTQV
jgi:flagellar hook-basal body complex protein FliE